MFTPLSRDEILDVVRLQIESVKKMLATNDITLDVTPAALSFLADEGFDLQFGARPVKRVIHRLILNRLSKDILGQKVTRERPIIIDYDGTELTFRN